jgi:hypothetical protein
LMILAVIPANSVVSNSVVTPGFIFAPNGSERRRSPAEGCVGDVDDVGIATWSASG